MKFRRRLAPRKGIDLTAMIDVVFNLLIFFMVGTTIINNPLLVVDLPEIQSDDRSEQQNITVSLTEAGEFYLNGEEVARESLSDQLTDLANAGGREKPVVIRPDKRIDSGELIYALNMATIAGFSQVTIAGIDGGGE